MRLVILILAQLILGLVNCQQYGQPQIQRDFIPQQTYGSNQRVFDSIQREVLTTPAPLPPSFDGYGNNMQDEDLSLDTDDTHSCRSNPCLNGGTCVPGYGGHWCLCLSNTIGDSCERFVTTTTRTPQRVPLRQTYGQLPQVSVQPVQSSYGQLPQLDVTPAPFVPVLPVQPSYGQLPQLDVTPAPFVPQYNRPALRVEMPTTTTTPAPLPLVQPSYGQMPQLDVTPAPFVPVLPVQPVQSSYGQLPQLDVTPAPFVQSACSTLQPCLNDGVCNDLPNGRWQCTCPWGWAGLRCEKCLTDCVSNPCVGAKSVCVAHYRGGYHCECPKGVEGENCDIQRDICSTTMCLNGGKCRPLESGEAHCDCREGFMGAVCAERWVNPCSEDVLRSLTYMPQFEYPWDRFSYILCVSNNTWVRMPCSEGTYFNKRLGHCVPEGFIEPPCPEGFCQNDGDCVMDSRNQLGCTCKPGFTGVRCDINIDECKLNNNACAGGMCIDQINTYMCVCPNSRVGLDCVNTIREPCISDNIDPNLAYYTILSPNNDHFLHCTEMGSYVVRKCPDGLFWHQEELTCSMDRPPVKTGACTSYPCINGGTCLDMGYNQIMCQCRKGYTGDYCDRMIDYCESSPCQNGGRCLPYAGGYTCVCPDRLIDDCCCSGVVNPCVSRTEISYFPHLMPNRYIHCDNDGRGFVRMCPSNTTWSQTLQSCTDLTFVPPPPPTPEPLQVVRNLVPTSQYGQQQDLPTVPVSQRPLDLQTDSYSSPTMDQTSGRLVSGQSQLAQQGRLLQQPQGVQQPFARLQQQQPLQQQSNRIVLPTVQQPVQQVRLPQQASSGRIQLPRVVDNTVTDQTNLLSQFNELSPDVQQQLLTHLQQQQQGRLLQSSVVNNNRRQ